MGSKPSTSKSSVTKRFQESPLSTTSYQDGLDQNCPKCNQTFDNSFHCMIPLPCKHVLCNYCFAGFNDEKKILCPTCKRSWTISKKLLERYQKSSKRVLPMLTHLKLQKKKSLKKEDYFKLKYLALGDPKVGISSLLERWFEDHFKPEYQETYGLQPRGKSIMVNEQPFKVKIYEPASESRLQQFHAQDLSKFAGIILCYDTTSKETFYRLNNWLEEIKSTPYANIKVIIVGTKCDLENLRAVPIKEVKEWASSRCIDYFETSAKKGLNVGETFMYIIQKTSKLAKQVRELNSSGSTKRSNSIKGTPNKRSILWEGRIPVCQD